MGVPCGRQGARFHARGPRVGWVVRAGQFLLGPAAVFITFGASLFQRRRLHASPALYCTLLEDQHARVCQFSLRASYRV